MFFVRDNRRARDGRSNGLRHDLFAPIHRTSWRLADAQWTTSLSQRENDPHRRSARSLFQKRRFRFDVLKRGRRDTFGAAARQFLRRNKRSACARWLVGPSRTSAATIAKLA